MKILALLLTLAMSAQVHSDSLLVKIKVLGSYWKNGKVGGDFWHNILVPENIKKEELIAVAKALFRDRPGYYRFFTDDKDFRAFIDADLHYGSESKDRYPYPEKWANKHYLAMINKHNHLGEWSLRAQSLSALKFGEDDSVIVILGKPDKPIQ